MTFINKITLIIHNWRKVLLVNLLVISSFSILFGQETREEQLPYELNIREDTPPIRERLFYGGSFGLLFGTITDIQVSPVIGFWVLPRIAVAAGPTYRYYKYQIDRTTMYGGRSYLQLVVIKDLNSILPVGVHTGIFFHLEDELLSLKTSFWKNSTPYKSDRFYVNTVLAGAGVSQQLGRRASMNFMVLWPLNDSGYEIYSRPEIKISFTF